MKEFIGTCVENPFERIEELVRVKENAKKIAKRAFLKQCFVEDKIQRQMKKHPGDYEFYKCIDRWYSEVYFYEWSGIEYFYG